MDTTDIDRSPELPRTKTETTEDRSTLPFGLQQRIEACKALYLGFQGRHHEAIERRMREMGHTTFNRRILYTRNQRGRTLPGWPERFGWRPKDRSEEHTSELQSRFDLVCRLLLEKKKNYSEKLRTTLK